MKRFYSIFFSITFSFICFFLSFPRPYRSAVEESDCPPLVYSIMKAESNFNQYAESKVGAKGLMQIMPNTADYLSSLYHLERGDLFDPAYNIKLGSLYLNYLYHKYQTFSATVAAYNAGEGNVDRWLNDKTYSLDGITLKATPFKETNGYLKKVRKNYKIYRIFYFKTLDLFPNLL